MLPAHRRPQMRLPAPGFSLSLATLLAWGAVLALAPPPALAQEPAAAPPLAYRFEVGAEQRYESVLTTTVNNPAAPTSEMTITRRLTLRVLSADEEAAEIELVTDSVVVDSPNPAASAGAGPPRVQLDCWRDETSPLPVMSISSAWTHALVGQVVHLRVRPDGTLLAAAAPDALAAAHANLARIRARSGLPEILSDDELAELRGEEERTLSVGRLQDLFAVLPADQPAAAGATWTHHHTRDSLFGGRIEQEITNVVTAVDDDGVAAVERSYVSTPIYPAGVEQFLRVASLEMSGSFAFDTAAGALTTRTQEIATSLEVRDPQGGPEWRTVGAVMVDNLRRLPAAE